MSNFSKKHVLKIENENDLQKEVVSFLRTQFPKVLFTATCGQLQDTPEKRIHMFEMGYRKGVPDLLIFEPNRSYVGMAIELKTPKGCGTISESQLSFMLDLKLRGWKSLISNDFTEIAIQINNYMSDRVQVDMDTDDSNDDSNDDDERIDCNQCGKTFVRQQTFATHFNKYHR